MTTMTGYEEIGSGGGFSAYVARPTTGVAPGVLVFQEIFGVNDNIRGLCDRLADAGFVAAAPDMFWRLEPRFERKDESGFADGVAMVQRFDFVAAVADIKAAKDHLASLPACSGRVGAIGFCLGGTLAFLAATDAKVDAAVSYYGSAVNEFLERAEELSCPTMFHYGTHDAFIPEEKREAVMGALTGKSNVQFHLYDAGHAFSNWDAPSMHDSTAADEAWRRTVGFLEEQLRS